MPKIKVPGSTSNLGSGFDCFGMALQIYLTVEIDFAKQLQIEVAGEGAEVIPRDENNLIFRATKKVLEAYSIEKKNLKIIIQNEIPLFRGLGSSGAAVIAGLLGGLKLVHQKLDDQKILNWANELEGHPENASASLLGGLTINCVENGQVIAKKIEVDPKLKAVLVIPEISISTHEARKILPEIVPHKQAVFNLQRSALLSYAFLNRDYSLLRLAMQDTLHQPYRKSLIPGYDIFEETAYENGALGVCISGSGSTILAFALASNVNFLQSALRKKVEELNIKSKIIQVNLNSQGVELISKSS